MHINHFDFCKKPSHFSLLWYLFLHWESWTRNTNKEKKYKFTNWIQGCFPTEYPRMRTWTWLKKKMSAQSVTVIQYLLSWFQEQHSWPSQEGDKNVCFAFTCLEKFSVWPSHITSFVVPSHVGVGMLWETTVWQVLDTCSYPILTATGQLKRTKSYFWGVLSYFS